MVMLRRLPTRAVATAAALFLLLVTLLPRPTSGSHVDPVYVGFNASCSDLSPAGATWEQFQISSVSDGTYSHGPLVVTLDVHAGTVTTIDWSSNLGVDGVFVKGGPGGYFYRYTSAATSDTGLTAPFNPAGQPFDPAHLLFCTEAPLETATPTM